VLDSEPGVDHDRGDLVVAVPVTHDGDLIGVVRVVAAESATRQVMLTWSGMAGLAVLVGAAVWLIARRQARRLALPLEQLCVTARRLGDGDFSVRTRPDDIPEIDAVGTALNTTAARLDELVARERAFSADASHQLRTPLAGLRLRLEAALDRPDGDLREAVRLSLADADRLEQTIDDLLRLARDTLGASVQAIDPRVLLAEIHREWQPRLDRENRTVEVQCDAGTPCPLASVAAVRQVLHVLLDNAVQHGTGTVTISIRESTDAVAIDVCDQGPGIEVSERELFARRGIPADGHGIGLALARRLAEAEGGRLHLTRPAPPTFTLLLPTSSGAESPGVGAMVATVPSARSARGSTTGEA
jgi:signal transduction histidine kinase